uniref:AMOP domain-containing protein n=1 Tax=Parascaris univalens TaxID=6257 RepID=A0A915CKA2_PARUN
MCIWLEYRVSHRSCLYSLLVHFWSLCSIFGQEIPVSGPSPAQTFPQSPQTNPNFNLAFNVPRDSPYYGVNLVPFGPDVGDHKVFPGMLNPGQMIDLHMYFPFYGGLYNYSIISVNGYIGFAQIYSQGPVLNVGVDNTDWPRQPDPAMIAPWLCKQQINQNLPPGTRAGIFYRLLLRQSLFGRETSEYTSNIAQPNFFTQPASQACPGTPDSYIQCNRQSDLFLEQMMLWLQTGVAGASVFRADAALVVTWLNTASGISGSADIGLGGTATYQVIWLTDKTARLSYVILNYDKLGFDADDFFFNSRNGRCQALFNGGNHTGTVPIDPTISYKNSPKILAQRSGVPHIVRGRYMFRVDDIVRPAGCSNKTSGTYPMLIYPNIVNMLGETTVDVNAMCLEPSQTYILMIEQRETATCTVFNPSIARCYLPRVFDWGTKTVYFQAQQGNLNAQDEKAFVGYIYFVPPTIDPIRLDIGNTHDWFENPIPSQTMPISWYPRNFTNPEYMGQDYMVANEALYTVQLGLYVIGYREAQDDQVRKFRPEYRTLCRLTTLTNRVGDEYRWRPQEERINIYQIEQWYLNSWERDSVLYTYRFGYFKLAPINPNDATGIDLLPGLVSSPVSIHWLWTPIGSTQFVGGNLNLQAQQERIQFVQQKAAEICHDWYAEDGAQYNFIRYTETNASCPCVESQARIDLGRFMPHPRCSQVFRDISCTTVLGSQNCYLSAQNVYTSYYTGDGQRFNADSTSPFETHYGQMCCYDGEGKLMQSNYQPLIKVVDQYPYNPGYPTRAYEFGTYPFMGQYEVPGFSAFFHDYMPYYFCCKYAQYRCQLFYWRRPTSGCQQYEPPATGYVQGAGSFTTLDNRKFIFNEPGVFTLLHIPQTLTNPEVRIQIRLERYPNRKVEFGLLGRYLSQADLVQPTNATVVTGIALEATGTDRVVVVVRKDTRRFRYRTSIIVGNIIRYFDNMKLQKFKG